MKLKAKLLASLRIWLVIYPSITLFLYIFGPALAGFPLYLRTLLLTLTLVPWMVFIGLPVLESAVRIFTGKKKTA